MRDLRDADRGDFSANKQTERTPMQVWIDQHVEGGTAGYHELGAGGEQTPPVAWRDRRQRDRDLRAARRQVHRAAYVTALVELHEEGRVAFSEKSVQRNMDAIRWRAYLNVESAGKPWPQMKAPHPRTLLAWMRALLAIRDRTFLIGFRIQGE